MLKKISKLNILLIFIVVISSYLRFFQLDINPPSLTWDEAAWGYNAYSLGIDGKDEFGRFLPIDYLESFGDFKPPMYAYLAVAPVSAFGLNEFATRFPSAFFGVLTVFLTYFLIRNIFPGRETIAVLGAFLLGISPWHILLSRGAFEANVASFFVILGVYLFIKGVRDKPWLLVLSAVSFVFSIYTFNTARVVAPLLVLVLTAGYSRRLWNMKKQFISAGIVGFLLLAPVIPFLLSPQASLRFKEVNIFSDVGIIERSNLEIANDENALYSRLIHNRRFYYGLEAAKHYFDNLSFDFLFVSGDENPKFSTGNVGQMYLWELPFFIAGFFFLFKRREGSWWIVPWWLVLGLIPASLARETPHALRTEVALPAFQIISAIGVFMFLRLLSTSKGQLKKYAKPIVFVMAFALFINVVYFLHGYFFHYPRETSREWQYGYEESIAYVESVSGDYDQVRISRQFGRPYIYYLFYLNYDPREFREKAVIEKDVFGFVKVKSFGKYHFGDGDINVESADNKDILVIETPDRVPQENIVILEEFKLLNGETAFVAYTWEDL